MQVSFLHFIFTEKYKNVIFAAVVYQTHVSSKLKNIICGPGHLCNITMLNLYCYFVTNSASYIKPHLLRFWILRFWSIFFLSDYILEDQITAVHKCSHWWSILVREKTCEPVAESCGSSVGVNNSSDPEGGGGCCCSSWRSSWHSSCCCSACSPSFWTSGSGGGGTAVVGDVILTTSSSIGMGSGRGAEGGAGIGFTGASGSIRLRWTCTVSSNWQSETHRLKIVLKKVLNYNFIKNNVIKRTEVPATSSGWQSAGWCHQWLVSSPTSQFSLVTHPPLPVSAPSAHTASYFWTGGPSCPFPPAQNKYRQQGEES